MAKTRLMLGILAVCLVAALTVPTFAQSNRPKIERVWTSGVGLTTALLDMNYNAQGLASRGWFEVWTSTGLLSLKTYGEQQNPASDSSGWISFRAILSRLTPGTTYYFRGVISSRAGRTESSVGSFKTSGAEPTKP